MKRLFFLIIGCAFVQEVYSQSSIATVDVLHYTGTANVTCVKKGQYSIKIINMNPLLYGYKDTVVLKLPPDNEVIANLLKTLHDSLLTATNKNVQSPASDSTSISRELIKTRAMTADVELRTNKFLTAFNKFKKAVITFESAKGEIRNFSDFCDEIISITYDPQLSQAEIKTALSANIVITNYIAQPSALQNVLPGSPSMRRMASKVLANLKNRYAVCVSEYNALQRAFSELSLSSDKILTTLLDDRDNATESMQAVTKVFESIKGDSVYKLAEAAGSAYATVQRNGSFERTITVNVKDADEMEYTLDIESKDKSKAASQHYTFAFRVSGGFRTFTAPGLMVNFAHARDEKYYLDADRIVRRAGIRDDAFPSLAVMQVFYWRSCKDRVWAGTIGLSANFANLNSIKEVRLFVGPAYVIGDRTKIIFSAGITGGNSEQLKGYFAKNKEANEALLAQENNVLTDQFFRIGFYAGVTIKAPN